MANRLLDEGGLTLRKGFPESYDAAALGAALAATRLGAVEFPGYSHVTYDVDPALARRLERPDVLIVEGLGLGAHRARLNALIYLHAAERDLEAWFVTDRFLGLWEAAADEPASFYARFRSLDRDGFAALARSVWSQINLPNLRLNIAPLRAEAEIVVHKGADHAIVELTAGARVHGLRRSKAAPASASILEETASGGQGMKDSAGSVRALALVGPTGGGKTALLEAMLLASGAIDRRAGGGAADKVGDTSPEARARGHSVELNLAGFDFLGDRYAVIDCPGAVELAAEADAALPAVDLAVIVAEPESAKAILLQPLMRQLEQLGVPRALFVNKMDQARGPLDALLAALAPVSAVPLVARQLPIVKDEKVAGFVDLALERAFIYHAGESSEVVDLAPDLAKVEADARFHMLEQLADFDDELMEQLLNDANPSRDLVFADLVRDMNEGLIVPVFFGSALNGFGVRRLLKALRHETPNPERAAARLGLKGAAAYVVKTAYAGQAGKLAYARVFGAPLADGGDLILPSGERARAGGLFSVQGAALKKIAQARVGDVAAIGKIDQAAAGDALSGGGAGPVSATSRPPRSPLYALAIGAANRKDDVRLSGALSKLIEEDPGLHVNHDPESHQVLVSGQGDGHVRLALERLKRRFGVEITTVAPLTPYRETIRAGTSQRGRHKKQTGGHGQFADVTIEIKPRPRGGGFGFASKITGGAVPRQWIPAVEQGVGDGLAKGPLGFPVVDLEVTLLDGAFHSVDSSEMAFRIAGRMAIEEGLRKCGSILLEPIDKLEVFAPASAMSNVTSALSARRGQILGFGPRPGWSGWETIEAYLPQSERNGLIAELRSLTQGLGAFEARFDHMAELGGRLAEEVSAARAERGPAP